LAPEQIAREPVGPETDIYALGVLTFRMLTGRFPFNGTTPEAIKEKPLFAPRPKASGLADVSSEMDDFLIRAMAIRPRERIASAKEFFEGFRVAAEMNARGVPNPQSVRAARLRRAVAVRVNIDVEMSPNKDPPKDLIAALEKASTIVKQHLGDFSLIAETGPSMLLLRLTEPADEVPLCRMVIKKLRSLDSLLSSELPQSMRVGLGIDCGFVLVIDDRPIAGELLKLGGTGDVHSGVAVSKAALAGLAPPGELDRSNDW
jgi:serine/threonine protein kinase